ncbi:MAG: type IV pilus secretin PilQ [Deferrisomatales bacterium]
MIRWACNPSPRGETKGRQALRAVTCAVLAAAVALAAGCASSPRAAGVARPEVAAVASPATQRVVVSGLELTAEGDATRIHLAASGPLRHQRVAGLDPMSVELDLFDVVFDGVPLRSQVGDGTVESVTLQALPGGAGRIRVQLAGPGGVRLEAVEGGLDLVVRLDGGAPPTPAAPGGRRGPLVQVLPGGQGLALDLGAKVENLSSFVLSGGLRLVVDVQGVGLEGDQITEELTEGPVARVRVGRRQDGGVRAVLEGRQEGTFEGHVVERSPAGFAVLWGASAAEIHTVTLAHAEFSGETPPAAPTASQAAEPPATGGGRVADLGFRQEPDRSLVEIGLSVPTPYEVTEATGERVVLDLRKTALPEKFRRALDTSAFPGPVKLVAAYERGPDTRIVVDLRRPTPYRLLREGAQLTLAFEGGSGDVRPTQVSEVREGGREILVIEGRPGAGPVPEGVKAEPARGEPAPPRYTGRRLSMDFVDADIRNVLRIIGEVSGLNVVAGDGVAGKVTVRLVDVPWDQALDVILKTRGLDQVREDTVIRIAPAERLAQERARAQEAARAAEEKAPLVTDIIAVNYATAGELAEKVKAVLTERGTVSVDQRTNALLVKDVVESVAEARALVAQLDTQTPQVMIEARIVEVSSTFARDLGIQWGGQFTADTAHGNATGWAFPHSVGVQGATGTQNFAVNFPAAVAAGGPGGAIGMTLGHINDVLTLDLRLSAIETSGKGRVLSSPRVTTMDNKTAEISQGIEIPFTTATDTMIETSSIDYKLKLNVTPHVTADRSIIMKIDVTKDAPSTTFVAVDSLTPAKETRAATTEVLVKDGETTVIGGIITDSQSHIESYVPFLGRIPYLGALFRQKTNRVDKTELIIFITPKIANVQALARNP